MPTADPALGRPVLASGSSDQSVVDLTTRLNELGYEVPVGDVVTGDVLMAVNQFRRAHKVSDDLDSLGALIHPNDADANIGPETWRALFKHAGDDELQARIAKLERSVEQLRKPTKPAASKAPAKTAASK